MYIVDSAAISPQRTFEDAFFQDEIIVYHGDRYPAVEPGYGSLIPAGLLRRMGKAVRIGVGAGLPLIQNHPVDGIILGTANGGLEDCLKFLNQIVDYEEGTLTPTNFVQSTPNAVAGNLALMSKVTGYNATHVHAGLAFESALLDGMLLFEEGQCKSLLLGNVEEISDYNHNIDFLSGSFKQGRYSSKTLLNSGTEGSVNGEGAAMFVVESERSALTKAQVKDVFQCSYVPQEMVYAQLGGFLEKNGLSYEAIDTVILGMNGDSRTDHLYTDLHTQFFPDATAYVYKHLVGDYPTAPAFATWLAVQVLAGKKIPAECLYSTGNKRANHVLIYNNSKGTQHGFILIVR